MPTPGPSLTLTLLQAREATMAFFRPLLNEHDLTEQGQQCFVDMSAGMESNYQKIQEQFGEESLEQLMELLQKLKGIKP